MSVGTDIMKELGFHDLAHLGDQVVLTVDPSGHQNYEKLQIVYRGSIGGRV